MPAIVMPCANLLGPVAFVATAYLALSSVNGLWAERLSWSPGVSWLYLPAALRPLAVLLFGWRGAAGLFVGGLLAMVLFEDMPTSHMLAICAVSALAPWVAVTLMLRYFGLPSRLDGLTPRHLLTIAFGCAALSVALHNLVYWGTELHPDPFGGLLPMFVGDIGGTLLVLYIARAALRLHARLRPLGR